MVKPTKSIHRGEPPASLMHMTGFMMYKLAQYLHERSEALFADGDIKARHLCVLHMLIEEGMSSQQRLCDGIWIDRATMVSVIDTLERNRLVRRTPHPKDRRCHMIAVTPAGKRHHAKNFARLQDLHAALFPSLSETELDQMRGLLRRMMSDACLVK